MPTLAEWVIDELDRDLAGRRRELADLRLLVATTSGLRNQTLARACQVMAYAHWEGFVKKALRVYLAHIVRLRIPVERLLYPLRALTYAAAIKSTVRNDRFDVLAAGALISAISETGSTTYFSTSPDDAISSANVDSRTLKSLLGCVGLEYLPAYSVRENYIDAVICGRRHRIAHGDGQPVTAAEARGVAADVLTLCDEVNGQVQTAAVYRHYMI